MLPSYAKHSPSLLCKRVFGFKEIYSPFVRDLNVLGEVFSQGVDFIRALFPNAKFIFHWRKNLTRSAQSDFWDREEYMRHPQERLQHFERVVRSYSNYTRTHPDHSFASTLEGLTNRTDDTQLRRLFEFLNEPLTSKLRRIARSHLTLHDWAEERHTRRIRRVDEKGNLVVETKEYAFTRFDETPAARRLSLLETSRRRGGTV